MSFSPDGKAISISSAIIDFQQKTLHNSVSVVDTQSCAVRIAIKTEQGAEFSTVAEFSRDGTHLVGSSDDGIQIWDAASGKKVYQQSLPEELGPLDTSLSPNGKWLVILGKKKNDLPVLMAMNMESKKITKIGSFGLASWKFSNDSKTLYVASKELNSDNLHAKLRMYEVGTWDLTKTFELGGSDQTFDISESKKLIVAGGHDGKFQLFSLESGAKVAEEYYYKRTTKDDEQRVPQMISIVGPVEFSPDGNLLMTAGARGNVILWQLTNGEK
jgi:WD40 repeat protein